MNTIFVWISPLDRPCTTFRELPGDYAHLDGVFLNASWSEGTKEHELFHLFYEEKPNGEWREKDGIGFSKFPVHLLKEGTEVITCGEDI